MKGKVLVFLVAFMAFVGLTLAQTVRDLAVPGGDPWWRPMNPMGQSYGVSVGLTRPVLDRAAGTEGPYNGEIFVDLNGSSDGGPRIEVYDGTNSTWDVLGDDFSALTANTLPKVNSLASDWADSNIVDDGTIITVAPTTFTVTGTTSNFSATTVNFSGTTIDIDLGGLVNFSADGSSTADAITMGVSSTADAQIYFDGSALEFDLNGTAGNSVSWIIDGAAGANDAAMTITSTAGIGTGSHTYQGLVFAITNVNHSGTSNFFNIIDIAALSGDANSNLSAIQIGALTGTAGAASETEAAIRIEAGWDTALWMVDGSATDDNITLGASPTADAQIFFSGSVLTFDVDGASTNDVAFNIGQSATGLFTIQNAGLSNFWQFVGQNVDGSNYNMTEIEVAAVIATTGSEVINLFELDWNETEWASSTATLNFISVQAFTPDATADYNAINIGAITGAAGTETAILIGAGWDTGLAILGDGSATDDNISLGASLTADAQIYFNGASLVFDVDGTGGNDITMAFGTNGFLTMGGSQSDFNYIHGNLVGAGVNFIEIDINAAGVLELTSDTVNMFVWDWNDTEFDTATGSTVNAAIIESITKDQNVDMFGFVQQGSGATDWQGNRFDAALELNSYRQDFDGPCLRWGAPGTDMVEDVADASVNFAFCSGGGINLFTYRLELAQASPFLPSVTGQGLDIENDGGDNAGLEIIVGDTIIGAEGTTDSGYYIRGQSPAMYFRVNITLASISGTDELLIGWRLSEAFITDAIWSDVVNTYAVHHINDNAGNLVIETDVNGVAIGVDENAIQAVFGDAETHTFEVQLSTACVATFFTNGLSNAVVEANDACEVGDIMMPWIAYRLTADVDLEAVINWIEIGEVI